VCSHPPAVAHSRSEACAAGRTPITASRVVRPACTPPRAAETSWDESAQGRQRRSAPAACPARSQTCPALRAAPPARRRRTARSRCRCPCAHAGRLRRWFLRMSVPSSRSQRVSRAALEAAGSLAHYDVSCMLTYNLLAYNQQPQETHEAPRQAHSRPAQGRQGGAAADAPPPPPHQVLETCGNRGGWSRSGRAPPHQVTNACGHRTGCSRGGRAPRTRS
jgi:hypothetical protein